LILPTTKSDSRYSDVGPTDLTGGLLITNYYMAVRERTLSGLAVIGAQPNGAFSATDSFTHYKE